MKIIVSSLFLCLLFSCANMLMNTSFQAMGIYDDVAEMQVSRSASKEIVFLPTHHLGTPIASIGYKQILDSIIGKKIKLKLKKEIIDQPSYEALGVPDNHSENVEATLEEVIGYYETTYGELKLEDCDFETLYTEETTCPKFKLSRDIWEDVLLDFRNEVVLKTIAMEAHDKIALIYGEGHMSGILKELKDKGYQTKE